MKVRPLFDDGRNREVAVWIGSRGALGNVAGKFEIFFPSAVFVQLMRRRAERKLERA